MEPIFKVNVESVVNAAKLGTATLVNFLLEKGIIYETQTEKKDTCVGCCFQTLLFGDCWAHCKTDVIYKWNTLSENYVGENEK